MVSIRSYDEGDEGLLALVGGRYFQAPGQSPSLVVVSDAQASGLVWFSGADPGAYVSLFISGPHRKIGSQAAPLIVEHAFNVRGYSRLATTVVSQNIPAIRIAETWGRLEGTLRGAFRDQFGQYHDVLVYGLLAHEWR